MFLKEYSRSDMHRQEKARTRRMMPQRGDGHGKQHPEIRTERQRVDETEAVF